MATNASTSRPRASSKPKKPAPEHKHAHWWERLLLYPTLAVALVTAGPEWINQVRVTVQGLKVTPKEADQQNQLWRKNLACSAAPFAWFNSISNVKVDTTTCDSGDVLVRAMTPGNGTFFKWVALDDVIKGNSGDGGGLGSPAHAATLPPVVEHAAEANSQPLFHLAQFQANVICQHFVDQRHILRRVSTPQGCFDEIIDTFNGQVVSRNPAPCTPQC
jgi:hypothetical protein